LTTNLFLKSTRL